MNVKKIYLSPVNFISSLGYTRLNPKGGEGGMRGTITRENGGAGDVFMPYFYEEKKTIRNNKCDVGVLVFNWTIFGFMKIHY